MFVQLNSRAWCSTTEENGGNCDIQCSDLIDDEITDDIKCAKQIITAEGIDAWGLTKDCLAISKAILKECFENVLDNTIGSETEDSTTSENIVEPSTIENYVYKHAESTENANELTMNEFSVVKIVDLVMSKIASIQSSDVAESSTQTDTTSDQTNKGNLMKSNNQMFSPKIQNFIMFNFNVKDSK